MTELNPLKASRIAALWYLALAVFGGFGIAFADTHFLVPGDAAATASLIQKEDLLFRLGIAAHLAGQACFVMTGLWFYRLLQEVDKPLARTLLMFVVAAVPIAFLNSVFKFGALLLLENSAFLTVFDPAQREALALFLLNVYAYGTTIVSVFWGLWLLPLGWLVLKSGFYPRVLGILLLVNGASYLGDSFLGLVFPAVRTQLSVVIAITGTIGEIPFLLWTLIRGARVKTPK